MGALAESHRAWLAGSSPSCVVTACVASGERELIFQGSVFSSIKTE